MAANGVDIKLGVSGVSQFKQNMNQAKQAVKTLDAQLTLTEKTFKQTGDAESYMTEKAELLKAKLEQQKQVLANAEKALEDMKDRGIDKASKAYQDMYRQMLAAKGALIDTQTQIDNVSASSETAAEEVSGMNDQLSNIGKGISWQNITEGFDKITGGIEKAAKKVISFGKQVASTMLDAGSWADDLQTRATFYEMTPEELQRMEKTARLIDTPVDAIINARKRLKKETAGRSETTMGAFAALGIDPDSAKDAEDLFWKTGEALMKMGDEYDKEAYAQTLFGRSWNELIPLFEAGRKEYEELNKSWNVVSQESIDALGEMDDEYQKLMANWETFKYEALSQFATPMKQALEIVGEQLEKIQDWLKSEEGQQFIENVIGKITEGVKWIVDHKEDAVNALKWIVVGWAGLKLAGGALHVLQLINGLTGLSAAGAASAGASVGASWASAFASAAMKAAPFLAFLYTMLKPADTHDDLGSGDIFDANGNLTEEAKAYGYSLNDKGELVMGAVPDKYTNVPEHTTIDLTPRGWGSTSEPVEVDPGIASWTERHRNANRAWEELKSASDKMEEVADDLSGDSTANRQSSSDMSAAAGQLKGLPGVIEGAIMSGMSGIKIYIDGQQAGNVLTPYVNSGMAGILAGLTK